MSEHVGVIALIVLAVAVVVIVAAIVGSAGSHVDRLADPTPLPGERPVRLTQTDDGAAPAAVPPVQPAGPHAAPSSHVPDELIEKVARILYGDLPRNASLWARTVDEAHEVLAAVAPALQSQALRAAEWRMFGDADGGLVDDETDLPVGALRQLLWDDGRIDRGVPS